MKPEDIRFLCAEALGYVWYRIPKHPHDLSDRRYRFLAHPLIHEYEGQSEIWLERADKTERCSTVKFMEDNGHLPDFLGNLNDAMQLCNALTEEGWVCRLDNGLDKTWECVFYKHGEEKTPSHYGAAATLSGAICESFLRVKGLWVETDSAN